MSASDAESRAYSRGYFAGRSGRWNNNAPAVPPQKQIAELMLAAQTLCKEIDSQLATMFDVGDPVRVQMEPHLQRVENALSAIDKWQAQGGDSQ